MPTTSQPSQQVPSNIIENEDLAWECFQKAVLDEEINTCYAMSLMDFEHFGVHDLFKVSNHLCSSSLLKDIIICIFIYLSFSFIHFSSLSLSLSLFFFFLGYVKIYCSVQAGHKIGQDEGLVRDEDSGGERRI